MANEKRLVNAEAIARKLKNAHCAECNVVRKIQCSACWVEDVLELLEGDAVDAVEVVHGRWIHDQVEGSNPFVDSPPIWFDVMQCSVCEEYIEGSHGSNYCPNCGAKMDGGTENENL